MDQQQQELLKMSVEAGSGGKNTVLFDDRGIPSIMVRIPRLRNCDLFEGGSEATHPAFIVNGQEKEYILVSKYQNVVVDGRPYSQPMKDPTGFHTFDGAVAACEAKGPGWHLMTAAEYALIGLWCKRNGFFPRGNNNYGADYSRPHERGVVSYYHSDVDGDHMPAHVFTGSGPVTWSHDGTADGIYDINGNMWEWGAGYRLMDGEIQVIANNDAAWLADQSPESDHWKAILPDGTLVRPGFHKNTLKWDCLDESQTDIKRGAYVLSDRLDFPQKAPADTRSEASYICCPGPSMASRFKDMKAREGVSVPELLKALAIFPADPNPEHYGGDIVFVRNFGERLPLRGGRWKFGDMAGVFAIDFCDMRNHASSFVAIRSCYVEVN